MEITATTQMWIGLVLACLFALGIYRTWVLGKTQKILGMTKGMTLLIAGALVIGSLWFSGVGSYIDPSLAGPTLAVSGTIPSGVDRITDGGVQPEIIGCDLGTKTTVTLSAQDKYTAAATGGTHRYRINGNPALTVSDAGTFTASPGDRISVLWANASAASTDYFSAVSNHVIPCTGAKTYSAQLVVNGTLSDVIKDHNDQVVDGSDNNWTLSAGDVKDATVKLSGTFRTEFPYGFVGVVEYNKTEFDDVRVMNVNEFERTSVPRSFSPAKGTDSSTKAYVIPALVSNADLTFKVNAKADASTNPATDGTIVMTLYPRNYFINSDTGGSFDGPSAEDEDGSVTRTGQATVTIEYD